MKEQQEVVLIHSHKMETEFYRILCSAGFQQEKAMTCSKIFTQNSLDGVYTHGVYRFPRFVQYVREGWVKPQATPVLVHSSGCIEQWEGNSGPGPLNAIACSNRAMELATQSGMGCVALANTNHWMRGGTYGWQAAKAGFVFIAWTNTIANMPPWGATQSKLGNNPLVIAVPYRDEAIVLDMAMSQYSFGALELQELKGQKLPVPGGFNSEGELTDNPSSILASRRVLPIGYWKGTGLSLLLDILATVLSGGLSVRQISQQPAEINVSQVFIAIDIRQLRNFPAIATSIEGIIRDYKQANHDDENKIVFPGEKVMRIRNENLKNGIPVFRKNWEEIIAL